MRRPAVRDSAGRWSPLIGYGSNPDLFHLGAYCTATQADSHGNPAGDYYVATRSDHQNNHGYGSLWKINLAETGIGTYGVNAGSQRYYGHDASAMSRTEAARIAAVRALLGQGGIGEAVGLGR